MKKAINLIGSVVRFETEKQKEKLLKAAKKQGFKEMRLMSNNSGFLVFYEDMEIIYYSVIRCTYLAENGFKGDPNPIEFKDAFKKKLSKSKRQALKMAQVIINTCLESNNKIVIVKDEHKHELEKYFEKFKKEYEAENKNLVHRFEVSTGGSKTGFVQTNGDTDYFTLKDYKGQAPLNHFGDHDWEKAFNNSPKFLQMAGRGGIHTDTPNIDKIENSVKDWHVEDWKPFGYEVKEIDLNINNGSTSIKSKELTELEQINEKQTEVIKILERGFDLLGNKLRIQEPEIVIAPFDTKTPGVSKKINGSDLGDICYFWNFGQPFFTVGVLEEIIEESYADNQNTTHYGCKTNSSIIHYTRCVKVNNTETLKLWDDVQAKKTDK